MSRSDFGTDRIVYDLDDYYFESGKLVQERRILTDFDVLRIFRATISNNIFMYYLRQKIRDDLKNQDENGGNIIDDRENDAENPQLYALKEIVANYIPNPPSMVVVWLLGVVSEIAGT